RQQPSSDALAGILQHHQGGRVSIAAYLKSLPPVVHRVPGNVSMGEPAEAPYVHFGVYQRIE
ncbi:MAG TPA: hypothetical protein DDZ21_10325, partial [Gammaproteobacteria bacterium]|nr:hypothetical protein [Gammaproteobacteria bacterium]